MKHTETNVRLSPALQLKSGSADETGCFTGMASVFGVTDGHGEVVVKGAFGKSLRQHASRGTSPAMLWSHHQDKPVGVWKTVVEVQDGLFVEGKLATDTERGRDARALMKAGALGLSIGFLPKKSRMNGKVRELTEIDLWEVSLVAMPANPAARIGAVKHVKSIREFEEHLRDAGFAKDAARRLASGGWPALAEGREDPSEGISKLAGHVKGLRTEILQLTETKNGRRNSRP